MRILQLPNLKYVNYFIACTMALLLVACSGGEGDSSPPAVITFGDLNVSWTAPSEREDNTALSLSEIAGFQVYYGSEVGGYQNQIDINDSSSAQAQVLSIPKGTYYVVVTVIDTDGRESSYSSEVIVTV